MQQPEISDIAAVWAMWVGFVEFGPVSSAVIAALPSSVKVFAIASVGYDRYDIDQFTRQGILVCNSPGMGTYAVADIALFLLLSTFRYTTVYEHILRQDKHTILTRNKVNSNAWSNKTGLPETLDDLSKFAFGDKIGGKRLQSTFGKRCGIVGAGAIGKEIVKRVSVMGMAVHYCTRTPLTKTALEELPAANMTAYSSLEELLPNCDIVILSLPLGPATHHLLNAKTIAMLPVGAKIVNVGRGPLIDTEALIEALESGHISSAGLDVFEFEPLIQERLLNRWDVTLLPHLGSCSVDTVIAAENNIMANIDNILNGGLGLNALNKL